MPPDLSVLRQCSLLLKPPLAPWLHHDVVRVLGSNLSAREVLARCRQRHQITGRVNLYIYEWRTSLGGPLAGLLLASFLPHSSPSFPSSSLLLPVSCDCCCCSSSSICHLYSSSSPQLLWINARGAIFLTYWPCASSSHLLCRDGGDWQGTSSFLHFLLQLLLRPPLLFLLIAPSTPRRHGQSAWWRSLSRAYPPRLSRWCR